LIIGKATESTENRETDRVTEQNVLNTDCWFAYFDILGFKKLLKDEIRNSSLAAFIEVDYADVLRELKQKGDYYPDHIVYTWASDSFVLFTRDNAVSSFIGLLESAGHFFTELTQRGWALRGAISYGEFYADMERFIFVGPTLIDACEYAGKLEMIGLVVTPRGRKRLQQVQSGYAGTRGDLREYPVQVKPVGTTELLWAYTFGKYPFTVEPVEQMKQEALNKTCEEQVIRKYDNTLVFLEATRQ